MIGIILLICLCLLLVMCGIMWRNAYLDRVLVEELHFPDFPDSFADVKIFFISDIHRRKVSESILSQIKGKADIVVIGGDITEKGVPIERVKENLEKLKGIGPLYFVWGNNDYETDYHLLDSTMLDYGVKILDNTAALFESSQGEKIALLGVDYLYPNRALLDLALEDSGDAAFKILVSHHPRIIDTIEEQHGIRLVLSGHTHGGQIRFFGFGPYELGGFKQHGKTLLLTSNGYGTSGIPLRLGAKPETHLLILKK